MAASQTSVITKRKLSQETSPRRVRPKLGKLVITIPPPQIPLDDTDEDSFWEINSLFSEYDSPHESAEAVSRSAPPIKGLYFNPDLLIPSDMADDVLTRIMDDYFSNTDTTNQVMLFTRAGEEHTSLPPYLTALLDTVSSLLKPAIPSDTHALLFPDSSPNSRQVIINMYRPGQGIAPHVDLLNRFGDGIIGVSLGSGCGMTFEKVEKACSHEVFLPPRSVIVLSEEARYGWTHGIEQRHGDWVQSAVEAEKSEWIARGTRVSVTYRWLLPDAHIVGQLEDCSESH